MKRILPLLLLACGLAHAQQIPISTFSGGGGSSTSTSLTLYSAFGQPIVYPRTNITQNGGGVQNANQLMFPTVQFADEPVAQPTGISFTNRAAESHTVTFAAASTPPSGYILLRKTGAAVTEVPVDGVTYTAGGSIGSATVIAIITTGSTLQVNEVGLSPSTIYHYSVFSYNTASNKAINYLTTSPLAGSQSTLAVQPAAPSGLVFSSVTSSSLTVSYSAPVSLASGYLVTRRAGAAPTFAPVDGVEYTQGSTQGNSFIAYVGTGTTFNQTGLIASTIYHYEVFSFNGTTNTYNYIPSTLGLKGNQATSASDLSQPTNLVLNATSTTTITGSFTAPINPVAGYLVVRKEGGSFTGTPVNGTEYSVGADLGDGVVVYSGGLLTFLDTGLSADTEYSYTVFSYSGAANSPVYSINGPLTGSRSTFAEEPSLPSSLTFSNKTATSFTLSFTAPEPAPSGYLVVRRVDSAPTGSPVDGTSYATPSTLGDGVIVYVGPSTSFEQTALVANTTYHYAVYAFNGSVGTFNYTASALIDSDVTLAPPPGGAASNLVFSGVTSSEITLAFTAAAAPVTGYLVTRKANSISTDLPEGGVAYDAGDFIGDTEVISVGSSLTFSDSGLQPGTTYFYNVYAFNGSGAGNLNYFTASVLSGSRGTLAAEPTAQPTSLVFTNISSNSLSGSFLAAPGNPSGYLVVRSLGALVGTPQDGIGYTVSGAFGSNGTVAAFGSAISFTQTGLGSSTTYTYSVFAFNGNEGTYNYLALNPLTDAATTGAAPPTQPTNLLFNNIQANSISGSFSAAQITPSGGYLVLRKAGSLPDANPVNGITYVVGNEIGTGNFVVSTAGPSTLSFTDSGLNPSTLYFYLIYSFNGTVYDIVSPLAGSQTTFATEPGTQPANLVFSDVTDSELEVSFTLPTGNLPVLVLRSSNVAPNTAPIDGALYAVGNSLGNATVVSVSASNTVNQTGLAPETEYFYTAYAFGGTVGTYNYRQTGPLTGSIFTLAAQPASQPTELSFSNLAATGFTVTIAPPTQAPAGYVVLRSLAASTAVPLNGTDYAIGDIIGDATVAYEGSANTFTETSLASETAYYYSVFPYNGSRAETRNYRTENPLGDNQTTLATAPTPTPTLAITQVTINSLTLTISGTSADGFLVLRSATASPDFVPLDGTDYVVGDLLGNAEVLSVDNTTQLDQSGLVPDTRYYFKVFAYNGAGETVNYAAGVARDEKTQPVNQKQPTNLQFSFRTVNSLTVGFTPPATSPGGYLVLRKMTSLPGANPVNGSSYTLGQTVDDATVAYVGSNTSFTNGGLEANSVYFYKVFSFTGATYELTGPLTGSATTLATEPATPVGPAVFTDVTSSTITISFTGSADGYLVVRRAGLAPTGTPIDGTEYELNDALGDGLVVGVGSDTAAVQINLTGDTEYFYAVYSFNGLGSATNYNSTKLAASERTLPSNPNQPSALRFENITSAALDVKFNPALNTPSGYLVLRRANSTPTGIPANGATYAEDAVIGNAQVAYVGPNAQFTDDGIGANDLTPETLYFYRIFAFTGAGASTVYVTEAPLSGKAATLSTEPGGPISNFVVKPGTLTASSVEVTYTTSIETPLATNYIVVRASGSASLAVKPSDGVSYTVGDKLGTADVVVIKNGSSFTQTGLTENTQYRYAIYPFRGKLLIDGISTHNYYPDALTGTITTLAVDRVDPTVSITSATLSTIATGTDLVVTANVSDNVGVSSVELSYKSLSGTTTKGKPMTGSSGTYTATIDKADIGDVGVEYTVIAKDAELNEGSDGGKTLVTFANPPLPASALTFGSDQSSYNIIAVPFTSASTTVGSVFDELGPEDKFTWRMFRYSEGSSAELGLNSPLEPGLGYWLIMKTQTALNLGDGTAVDPGTDGFSIPLQQGYNQIGNPYMFPINWSDVLAANSGITADLKTFDGNFAVDTKLDQYEGGFVNVTAATTLKFPPIKAGNSNRENTAARTHNPLTNPDWQVHFTLQNGVRKDVFGGFGMHPQASVAEDRYDDFTMPRLVEYIELNHAKERFANLHYTKDIVPPADDYTWQFEVVTNLSGLSTMQWDNSYFGDNESQLVLWDETEQRAINMREATSHSFEGNRKFKVVFGGEGYVKEQTQTYGLVLHKVYPNPADDKALISFTLPEKQSNQKVTVTVLNQLGQVAATVFTGELGTGFHEVEWKIKEAGVVHPAGGVYIISVNNGYDTQTKRIIIK